MYTAVRFSVILVAFTGLHLYMWARLVRSTKLQRPWRTAATALIVGLGVYLPLAFGLGRWLSGTWPPALVWPGALWAGLALYLVLALVTADVLRWLVELGLWLKTRDALQPGQQVRLYRQFGAGAVVVAVVLTAVGAYTAAAGPGLREIEVPVQRLPAELDGLTIVQITDLHAGRTIGRNYVAKVVRQINALEPDLVVITGDLVDGKVAALADVIAPIFELQARWGVFFVTGNHDYYSGAKPWREHLRSGGIRVLSNELTPVGEGSALIDLAGIEDPRGYSDVRGALAKRDPRRPVVLLSHRAEAFEQAAPLGVDLQLSGHTHGGQLWPFTFFVRHTVLYPRGLYRRGQSWLYVSPGAGYVGPPIRLGMPAEITRLTLRRAEK